MKHTLSALALLSIATTPLFAKEDVVPAIPELPVTIVTGELWESELQETAASVTVIDDKLLQSSGTQHFGNLINAIPNMTWSATSSRPRYIQIRGIGENSQFEGETPDSSVRFMVDDLDFTGLGTIGNLFDTQQVEVLRGSQAGAFGANAAGGVVQIVTNDPTPYWTGQVEYTAGDDCLFSGGLAIGGPLLEDDLERLTFRFSMYQLQQDGFRDNKFLDRVDTNERNEFNTRLKLRWIANEDWQWDGTLFYADSDNGYDEWTLNNTEFDTFSDTPGRDEQESFAASLRGKWTGLSKVDVSTITSFSASDSLNSADGDWTNELSNDWTYSAFIKTDRDRDRWSQEVRFDSVDQQDAMDIIDRWTTGLHFEDFKEDTKFRGDFGDFDTTYETRTFSVYGQATRIFSDNTRLTLGLRTEYYDLATDVTYSNKPATNNDPNFDDWLYGGKLTFEHNLSATKTLFASITKGYKAGGANIYPELEADVPTNYDTEDLWNYEISLRSDWFDSAVISQITVFYIDREDAQLRSSTGQGINFTYATENAGHAEHYGAEFEGTWFINKNWFFTTGFGLLETELEDTAEDLSSAPSYTYNTRIDYIADNGFFANLEVTASDEFYESNNRNNREERIRSHFAVFNGAIGYRYKDWTLTLWGRNVFDDEYEKRVFFFDNGTGDKRFENPADPQQFGATLNYSW